MEIFLIKAAQLLCCFMLLVLLHEGGHFFFAKVFGIRVKKFCLFFDPYVNWKLFSFRGTDYHVGWLPLGGYVNIAGMVDESTSAEDLEKDDTPKEEMFMYKPAWQRLLVMVGGVLVNFITALIIYSAIFAHWGEEYVPADKMTYGYVFNDKAKSLGFEDGDIIVATNGQALERWGSMRDVVEAQTVTVLRNGAKHDITLGLSREEALDAFSHQPPFATPAIPSVIDSVMTAGPADKGGLRKGDQIVAFNGHSLRTWNELDQLLLVVQDEIAAADGKVAPEVLTAEIVVKRAGAAETDATTGATVVDGETGATQQVDGETGATHVADAAPAAHLDTLKVVLSESGKLGVIKHNVFADYETETIHYNALTAIPAGVRYGWNKLCDYVTSLKYLFTKDGAKSVGSFGTIGSLFPDSWNWLHFWELTAFISIMLAFMNFLPIPMLDGGYIFLTLLEIITRRKFSEKAIDRINTVGFYFVLALMGLGIFNDFARMVFHLY